MNKGLFCDYCGSKLFEPDRVCPRCGAPTIYAVSIPEIVNDHKEPTRRSNELTFIAGTRQDIMFNIFDSEKSPLSGGNFFWKFYKYGEPEKIILENTSVVRKDGTAFIHLEWYETQYLSGKYVQDPMIKTLDGNEFYVGKSIINIVPKLDNNRQFHGG